MPGVFRLRSATIPGPQRFSTGELMRLVVLVALNLVFFQGAWWWLLLPPIGLLAITLNLVLFAVWVRRRALSREELAAALAGLLAVLVIGLYCTGVMRPWMADQILQRLPEPLINLLRRCFPFSSVAQRYYLDYGIQFGLGLGAMLLAGWLTRRIRRRGRARDTDGRAPSP